MFDSQLYTDLRAMAERAAAARSETGLATGAQVCDALRVVQQAQDILDGVHADLLARLESTEGYAEEASPTAASWATQQLRLSRGEARKRVKAGHTLRTLPELAESFAAGRVRLAHVVEFSVGITKLGADVMADAEPLLVPVAESSDPQLVREAINHLYELVHPDKLDDDYAKGMNKRDLRAAKCGDGWHVSGFLDPVTGTKFSNWLKAASRAESDGDDRSPADRRVDAFGRLLDNSDDPDAAAADVEPQADVTDSDESPEPSEPSKPTSNATPNEQGSSPHSADPASASSGETRQGRRRSHRVTQLMVLADLNTLLRRFGAEPATLVGFGHIGGQLLGYLTCDADATGLLTDGTTNGPTPQADVLNVGRTSRLATAKQRHAVVARQHGVCANPGCILTHIEIHHVRWWHRDQGATDVDNLVGLCSRCHHLVHQERLTVEPDGHRGFVFRRRTGRIIDDHTRISKQKVRDILASLRHLLADDADTPPTRAKRRPVADAERLDRGWLTRIDQIHPGAEEHLYEFIGGSDPPART